MVSGGADDPETIRAALQKALQGLPMDPGQSEALKKYLETKPVPGPVAGAYYPRDRTLREEQQSRRAMNILGTATGWSPYCGPRPLVAARDWLRNPEDVNFAVGNGGPYNPRISVGYRPYGLQGPEVAVGNPWAAAALGAGLYAAIDGYKHGFPHVAQTLLGQRYGSKAVDLARQASSYLPNFHSLPPVAPSGAPPAAVLPHPAAVLPHPAAVTSGRGWRPWYGRPGTGLPQRMRAGIDTASQGRPNLPLPLIDSLAARMRRAVA